MKINIKRANKYWVLLLMILAIACPSGLLDACTMTPAMWHEIEKNTAPALPSIYALSEAILQIKQRYEKELRASSIPIKPLLIIDVTMGDGKKIDVATYDNLVYALNVVWNKAYILSYADLCVSDGVSFTEKDCYRVSLAFDDSKFTSISMIDLNPQFYELLRLVTRDELKVFVRILDSSDLPVFVEELEISPTIMVDPLLSPLGGFFIRIEKNNFYSAVIDFGSLEEGGEHILRVNNAFYPPSVVPPLIEFRTPLVEMLDAQESHGRVYKSLVLGIKSLDYEFFMTVLDTYPDFDVNFHIYEDNPLLHLACGASAVEMVKKLLECGGNVSILNASGDTALHIAARNGLIEIMATLLHSGADVNSKNVEGDTPLHLLSKVMTRACAHALFVAGANIFPCNPFDY